jgi:queuine tRNA-ribosyltransferase
MDYPGFNFELLAQDPHTHARLGRITTPHGSFETPNFIFCATKGAIKGVHFADMQRMGVDIVLSNTYHLLLRPGAELVAHMGGLHRFMGWDKPLFTDSGGFQVFSLGHGSVAEEIKGRRSSSRTPMLTQINEQGARFRSYIDGSSHILTPEISIDVQRKLGADLIVVLDECTPFHVDKAYTEQSMHLSHRWSERSLAEFERGHDGRQALIGIVQGGVYEDLRQQSAEYVASRPFFGQAVGGSLGADKAQMYEVVAYAMAHLRRDRPTHLLGVGGVDDIWQHTALGIDTFDCVSPTRIARHAWALVRGVTGQRLNLRNARFRNDSAPLEEDCDCPTCQTYSRAYVHYLFKAGEMHGIQLLALHNVRFMVRLFTYIRTALRQGNFAQAQQAWMRVHADGDVLPGK